ncbi:MAG TPA: MBL fold metallo-hydrolase [Bacteroidales bacterium]|nr:MBL fold metallo-hydrolase [Bacteroidales bacterium]
MKITFLGTGTSQGVPVIACPCEVCHSTNPKDSRLRTSLLIEINDIHIVIDSGPDFRQQMLNADVKTLDAILFTHEHRDHIAGLDDVRAYNYIQQQPMDVYAEERVQNAIMNEFDYIFAEHKYPGIPQVNMHKIDKHPFEVQGIAVVPIRVMHMRLPVLGFRIGDLTYITDANFISDEEKHKIRGSKVIIITGLRKQKHISHFSLSEAVELLEEFKPEKGYITHISHQMGFHNEVQAELPPNIALAYDNLTFEL